MTNSVDLDLTSEQQAEMESAAIQDEIYSKGIVDMWARGLYSDAEFLEHSKRIKEKIKSNFLEQLEEDVRNSYDEYDWSAGT